MVFKSTLISVYNQLKIVYIKDNSLILGKITSNYTNKIDSNWRIQTHIDIY